MSLLQAQMDFVIGGLAGAGATIFTNPMDVLKTRYQLQGELRAKSEKTTRYRGIFQAVYVIVRNDGILALQKGLAPALLLGFSLNSVRLGIYHIAEGNDMMRKKDGDISVSKTLFWSGASGVVSGVASNPATVLKTRMQATSDPKIAVGRQHSYNGMIDGFRSIYKNEGIRGFFAGVNATCARLGIGSAAQLTSYSTMKGKLLEYGYFTNSPAMLAFVSSLMCGVLSVIIETPLDVVNTRLYNQGPASTGEVLYNGMFDCLKKIYINEGIHGLYKGLLPFYLRIAPHTTISLVIWDVLNNLCDVNKKK